MKEITEKIPTPEERRRIYEEEEARIRAERAARIHALLHPWKKLAPLMTPKLLVASLLVIIMAIAGTVAYQYHPVVVTTGQRLVCSDPRHQGDKCVMSAIKTLTVPRRDASEYGIREKQIQCEKCQARQEAVERAARARQVAEERAAEVRRETEGRFIRAVKDHDALVYSCRERFVTATSAGNVSQARREIRQLRRLAYAGKKLYAPPSLSNIGREYRQSMDECLQELSCMEGYLRDGDEGSIEMFAIHTAAAKIHRDNAMDAIALW